MARDPETTALRAHQEWLGFLQPIGLVVSPPALVAAQAILDRNVVGEQQRLEALVEREGGEGRVVLRDFRAFAEEILGWEAGDLVGEGAERALPDELEHVLPDYGETLRPTWAVPVPREDVVGGADAKPAARWLLLVQRLPVGAELDAPGARDGHGWHTSPQAKLERLLRETEVPIGLLLNGEAIRLVYAPRGESAGFVTFPVQAMTEVAGRPILAALLLLLSADRLFVQPRARRLPALLEESRKYQNQVSNELAEQVLRALNELLRGFQSADELHPTELLAHARREDPQEIYGGLLTTLMRLVFLLYAEDRGLMPDDETYVRHYGVTGLYERLRQDADRRPDTMDARFGAWAQLLALHRLVHDGGGHGGFRLPARHGELFDPNRYPFLEGRPYGVGRVVGDAIDPPRVSDGVVLRVLEDLLVLRGERLSYRALDVEQIGSVYESMMGFELEVARGPSIGVKPDHVVVDVGELLAAPPKDRGKLLADRAKCKLTGKALKALKDAVTPDDLVAALGNRLSPRTPRLLPEGALYLQPSEERRRSGSHYTPRSLTEPIVRTTLRPVLENLAKNPTPEQILELKVCDPAMGSGAFLVEACRQLAEVLVEAWNRHDAMPTLPADTDPLLHARRLISQRCLYGVDKNPYAVGLAKLSLWLVTLARDHPFSFVDHALRHGDSLVGMTREQIARFHWDAKKGDPLPLFQKLEGDLRRAAEERAGILALGDAGEREKRDRWDAAQQALADARLTGDLLLAAFFAAGKPKAREDRRQRYWQMVDDWRAGEAARDDLDPLAAPLRDGPQPVPAFHWGIEFSEVFERENGGFDAVVGNPPFAGGSTISTRFGASYLAWLLTVHPESHGNGDLVAHFFRRSFALLRHNGCFGLVATNTIAQGDTRTTGLSWICRNGGSIYAATRRESWPGSAAVIVSVLHIRSGDWEGSRVLDGRDVPTITAFLFHAGGHENPAKLRSNQGLAFLGSKVYGQGFLFDDTDKRGTANSLDEMRRLIARDPRNSDRIFPYITGAELNSDPRQEHHRYVVDFGRLSFEAAQDWPDLLQLVRDKVKPERDRLRLDTGPGAHGRKWWWQFQHTRRALYEKIKTLNRVLANSQIGNSLSFAFLPTGWVYSHALNIFALQDWASFAVLQSRPHEIWARFFGSSMKDDLRYTFSDCFETFPFPPCWEANPTLEAAGRAYYEFRAALMSRDNEGLTATFNRFHDPEKRDPNLEELRELHAAMDRAVLDAYGWTDIPTDCDFLLDYEEDDDGGSRRKKKPWRYRWPDEVREEVLARLLELNKRRAEEERLAGLAAAAKAASKKPAKRTRKRKKSANLDLFPEPEE